MKGGVSSNYYRLRAIKFIDRTELLDACVAGALQALGGVVHCIARDIDGNTKDGKRENKSIHGLKGCREGSPSRWVNYGP